MVESLTHAMFVECVGSKFRIHLEQTEPVEMELTAATLLPMRAPPGGHAMQREPFSLLFCGPVQFPLPQRTYRVEHDRMGTFDLFIVPLGPDGQGFRYEAIFT